MKIGLFGGTYNPVHNAHLFIAEEVIDFFDLDKLFIIPAYIQPFKKNHDVLNSKKRIELIKEAIDNDKIAVSDYEIKQKSISYSIKTVKEFSKKGDIYFIIGSDSAFYFDKWKNYNKIIDMVKKIVVFPRKGYPKNKIKDKVKSFDKFTFLNTLILEISSTDIRKRIAKNKNYKYLVPKKVYKMIEREGLYK